MRCSEPLSGTLTGGWNSFQKPNSNSCMCNSNTYTNVSPWCGRCMTKPQLAMECDESVLICVCVNQLLQGIEYSSKQMDCITLPNVNKEVLCIRLGSRCVFLHRDHYDHAVPQLFYIKLSNWFTSVPVGLNSAPHVSVKCEFC